MAASSLELMRYQVFLNFRGEDTREGFTARLYEALVRTGIHTFLDEEEIEPGEKISERLVKAIEESRYCVVILSKGYADSKWCLMELAFMFEQKKEIVPVFYYVEPSDVCNQKGPFEKAFRKHEVRSNSADVEEWKQAMTKVGRLEGGFVINHRSNKKEVELIEEIVESMVRCRDNLLYVADHPVGMDSRVEDVMELLNIEEGGVRMVGIYGMEGVGKTTLAKEIHNRLLRRFDRAIYIEGIKDKRDRLPKLQEEFISKAFRPGNLNIYNSSEGVTEIRRFRHRKVLAVLDDIDHRDQLKALAGGCDWFGEGTRILITTRDERLLDAHHVDKKYEVNKLNSRESLQLFSWHAFKNDQPSEEYMEISKRVAKAAGGLPLALEVLGSSLSEQNDMEAWEEVGNNVEGFSIL